MRFRVVTAALLLAGCGSGGTTGTNYSDAPPVAEIVATPTAAPSATPDAAQGEDAATDAADNAATDPASGLPADVAAYVQKRDRCDHWRGEEASDAARKREIDDAIARECTGLGDTLTQLRDRYASDEKVRDALGDDTE